MNQKQPLCKRARDLDYIARPDQEGADKSSGSQFCFVVLHHLNARRSLPPGGCTETWTVSWRSQESQRELVTILLGLISLSTLCRVPCAYRQRPLAPDERPGSLSPEMELRKCRV